MNLQFIPFTSPTDKGWDEAAEIDRTSFPDNEQRAADDHLRAIADPRFSADGVWEGEQLVGILYYWHTAEFDYVEHLAVAQAYRGQRVGTQMLTQFCRGRRVILEIDPPVDAVSVRRRHFYESVGFCLNPHRYMHPSYKKQFSPLPLVLMSYPTPLTDAEAHRFADFVRTVVLVYSEHRHPQLPTIP